MDGRARLILGGAAVATAVAVLPHPRADLTILAHDAADPTPRRAEIVFDAGLLAGRVLVTWTAERLRR